MGGDSNRQKLKNLEQERGQELFPVQLPSLTTMGVGLLIILIFSVAALAAFLVPFPEMHKCPLVLITEGGADPVRATFGGVLAKICVKEAQKVARGQELFVIRSNVIRSQQREEWTTELLSLEEDIQALEERKNLIKTTYENTIAIQETKIQQYEEQLRYQEENLATYQEVLQRMELLDQEGLVSPVDMLSHQLGASQAERDRTLTRQSREIAALDLERFKSEYRREVRELELEIEKAAVRSQAIRRQLQGSVEDVIRVSAPFAGTVVSMERRTAGEVVSYGQELCQIARSDGLLVAQLTVPEEAVPRLRLGQTVQLFFDAYPYQRFGTGTGRLSWISPAAIKASQTKNFLARVSLDEPVMTVEGEAQPLRVGMQGEARIIVGKRTLIEYVFDPIRQLRENLGP